MSGLAGIIIGQQGRAREALGAMVAAQHRQSECAFGVSLAEWMLRPLAELTRSGIEALERSMIVDPEGVQPIWSDVEQSPPSSAWSRALGGSVPGRYLWKTAAKADALRLAS